MYYLVEQELVILPQNKTKQNILLTCKLLGSWSFLHLRLPVTHVLSSRAGTGYPSGALDFTPVFSEVRVVRTLVFCVVYCRQLIFRLYFFFLIITLFVFVALSLFDVWILFTPLVSSNSLRFFLVSKIENQTLNQA